MWVCRLPVYIGPAECTRFMELCVEFVSAKWADRVVGPYGELSMHPYPVGADDSVRPQDVSLFLEICGEFVTSQRADVGIGPYTGLCIFSAAHRAEQSPAPTDCGRRFSDFA